MCHVVAPVFAGCGPCCRPGAEPARGALRYGRREQGAHRPALAGARLTPCAVAMVSRATSGAALRCSSLAARLALTTSLMSWCWTRTRCRPCSCARHRHRCVCARVCTRGSGCVFLCLCVGWVGCVWVRLCARVCLCLCVFFVREFRGGDDLSDPAGACSFCCVGGCTRWSTRTCSRT
jgi:hypothetical protein